MKNNLVFIVLLIFLSCKNHSDSNIIGLWNKPSEIVKSNSKCSEVFNNKFGITTDDKFGYDFIDTWIAKLETPEHSIDFTKLILFQLKESGEVDEINRLAIRVLKIIIKDLIMVILSLKDK